MNKPVPVTIEAKQYYNSKDLFAYNPEFYYGCKTKPRTILQKKNIPPTDYIYANLKSNEWNLSTEECKKAQLLLAKSWVDVHYFKPVPTGVETVPEVVESETKTLSLVELEDHEKFKDEHGTILDIETCGEKTRTGIYFKVQDVMKVFDIPRLDDTMRLTNSTYERGSDYDVFFIRPNHINYVVPTIKKGLYLTYHGMLRVLFVTRNKKVDHFQSWAEDKLFTIQMGSKKEKIKLGTKLLDLDMKTYKAVFESHADKLPAIYLLTLGTVGELRDTFGIDPSVPNDSKVHKFGGTDSMGRRCGELGAEYNKLSNVHATLSIFQLVDESKIFHAEDEIRSLCNAFKKRHKIDKLDTELVKKLNELIILDKEEYKTIHNYYNLIGNKYAGSSSELLKQNAALKDQLRELEHEIALQQSENKLLTYQVADRDRCIADRDRCIADRDRHIADREYIHKLELQLASNRSTNA